MSKISVEGNGQSSSFVQTSRFKNLLKYTNHEKTTLSDNIRMIPEKDLNVKSDVRLKIQTDNIVAQNPQRKFHSLIPKMETKSEKKCDQNPRILDLRQKLNDITKRQDRNVDKTTKGLINNITQQLSDEKDQDISGPYSLLFDLQCNASTSHCSEGMTEDVESNKIKEDGKGKQENELPDRCIEVSNVSVLDRLPNVVNFDEKPMKEFEYSCEKEVTFPPKRPFNSQSRSDLCLHFKSNIQARPLEQFSPNENSSSRTNEENSLDDSLGILTPDQMDDICYLENAFSPTVEGLPMFCDGNTNSKFSPDNGDSPSTDKTESNSAASTMFMQNDSNDLGTTNNSEQLITPTVPAINIFTHDSTENINKDVINSHNDANCSRIVQNNCHHDSVNTQEVILSSSQNEKPLSKDIFDIKMDELGVALIEDELLPSMHSSILEPISSITDTTVNLELPLDCKHSENRLSVNRIEQTPSPEDLPLDSSEINGEISTYSNSQFSGSTLHDSQTFSDSKNDYQKSMETSKVSNSFITSITSITSLDGYQGDGEMSRPVSRGGDHSIGHREDIEMDWQNIPVARRTDPMTDSDFFTESDADGLDDQMHRGDRKAQVIDGALYGGKNNSNGIAPLIVNRNEDSCMESSGVYTDFENHRSSPVFLNAIDDLSPDGSSPSTHSECSQKNGNLSKINEFFSPSEEMMEDEINSIVYPGEPDTLKLCSKRNSLNNEKENRNNEKLPKEEKRSFMLKKYKMPKRDVPSKLKIILANRKTDADNSTQSSPKAVKKSDRRENISKKNNTNELKNDYKAKNYKDVKSKVDCSYSLQRSQTSCSVTRLLSSKSVNNNIKPKSRHMRMRMDLGSANGSGKSSLHSSQSDISASSTPLGKPTSRFPLIRSGKKRDSGASGPPPPPRAAPPPNTSQPPAQAKKNGVVQKLASSPVGVRARQPPASPRAPAPRRPGPVCAQRPTTLPTKEPPRVASVARGKRPAAAATPPPRSPAAPQAPAPALPAPPPAKSEQAAVLAHAAKGVEALGVLVQYLVFQLDSLNGGGWRAEAARWRGLAAAERSSAARADLDRQRRAQKDFDTIAECLNKISELEREVSAKDEAQARLRAAGAAAEARYRATLEEIAGLATDIKGLKSTIESLKHEVAESRARLHAQGERERALRAQLEAARAELARERDRDNYELRAQLEAARAGMERQRDDNTCLFEEVHNGHCGPEPALPNGSHCDTMLENGLQLNPNAELSKDANELAAEVRSLRAVLELKQAEAVSLRSVRTELAAERERSAVLEREVRTARHAAEELRERAAARQRDSDRLKDDNRRLRDAAARDREQAARLAAQNEELRYKLRQKSQVVSLLAGGGYIERTLRTRTTSGDSARSPSPPPDTPPSPAASPSPENPALPAVKGVVEKHDSVSWVLEIEDSPEEVASRLARRSSFRTAASSSGVKRRGGGSPGSGSPAPASPAPNASKLFRPGELDFPPVPPPLKESAGEAIYIYDDRQY